jgi:hypothetical protein
MNLIKLVLWALFKPDAIEHADRIAEAEREHIAEEQRSAPVHTRMLELLELEKQAKAAGACMQRTKQRRQPLRKSVRVIESRKNVNENVYYGQYDTPSASVDVTCAIAEIAIDQVAYQSGTGGDFEGAGGDWGESRDKPTHSSDSSSSDSSSSDSSSSDSSDSSSSDSSSSDSSSSDSSSSDSSSSDSYSSSSSYSSDSYSSYSSDSYSSYSSDS